MAEAAARHLVQAEEQGLPIHGMSRVPFYCSMLRNGRADGRAHPAMAADRAAVCRRAQRRACRRAREFAERVETVVAAMQADLEVRLPGARRFAARTSSAGGIEVPVELLAQIEKLCST